MLLWDGRHGKSAYSTASERESRTTVDRALAGGCQELRQIIAVRPAPRPASADRARRPAGQHPSSGTGRCRSSREIRQPDPSRHERNDCDRGEESHGRTGGAENAEPLVPEACEQQRTEGPLRDAEEPAGALQAKYGIQPPDQWTVADERNESLRFVCPPFLIPEEQEDDHHGRADEVVIEILREQAEPAQDADKWIECG